MIVNYPEFYAPNVTCNMSSVCVLVYKTKQVINVHQSLLLQMGLPDRLLTSGGEPEYS